MANICMAYGFSIFFVRGMWRHGWVQKTCITSPIHLPSTECCNPGREVEGTLMPMGFAETFEHLKDLKENDPKQYQRLVGQ